MRARALSPEQADLLAPPCTPVHLRVCEGVRGKRTRIHAHTHTHTCVHTHTHLPRRVACTAPFQVTLTWFDPAASPAAALAIVNDLDLVVRLPLSCSAPTPRCAVPLEATPWIWMVGRV